MGVEVTVCVTIDPDSCMTCVLTIGVGASVVCDVVDVELLLLVEVEEVEEVWLWSRVSLCNRNDKTSQESKLQSRVV